MGSPFRKLSSYGEQDEHAVTLLRTSYIRCGGTDHHLYSMSLIGRNITNKWEQTKFSFTLIMAIHKLSSKLKKTFMLKK